jgi:hypothetical protein
MLYIRYVFDDEKDLDTSNEACYFLKVQGFDVLAGCIILSISSPLPPEISS